MAAPPRPPAGPQPGVAPSVGVRPGAAYLVLPPGHSGAPPAVLLLGHPGAPPASLPPDHPGVPPASLPPGHPGAPLASLPPGHPGAPLAPLPPGHPRAPPAALPPGHPGAPLAALPPGHPDAHSPPETPPLGSAPPGNPEAFSPASTQPAQPLPHAAVPPPTAAAPPAPAATLPPPEPQPVALREPAQKAHLAAPKQYTAQTAGQIPGTRTVATVKSAPSDPLKREYVTAVRAYEEQVGANIVRGKMFVESLPMNRSVPPTGMLPGMVPGMTRPGMECGYNMAMGAGGPCGYGQQNPMGGGFGASSLGIQRNREDFENMMDYSGRVDFARMAEMGPQVRRLLDMGSQIDQIMDMIRRAEGSLIIMGSDSAGRYRGLAAGFGGSPPTISGGGFGVPMPGGYGGPMMPPYGAPPMMVGSGFGLPMPGGYGGPMMRPYGAPMPDMTSAYSAERFLGGYKRPAMNPRMSGSTDWRKDNPRELGRRTMSRESARPPRDEYTEGSRLLPKQSMSRASDLLQKIKEEIDEHRAETVLEKIHRDVVTMDAEDDVGCGSTARRISIPPEMGKMTSRTSIGPCDDWDYRERRSPRPMRRTSRHHKSSSSSSSSASSHGKPLKQRLHKSKDSKGKRRKSQGKKRRGSAPAKNGSSASSSSSSSGRRSPRNKGDKSIKFVRQVTEWLSSESSADEDLVAVMNEFQ